MQATRVGMVSVVSIHAFLLVLLASIPVLSQHCDGEATPVEVVGAVARRMGLRDVEFVDRPERTYLCGKRWKRSDLTLLSPQIALYTICGEWGCRFAVFDGRLYVGWLDLGCGFGHEIGVMDCGRVKLLCLDLRYRDAESMKAELGRRFNGAQFVRWMERNSLIVLPSSDRDLVSIDAAAMRLDYDPAWPTIQRRMKLRPEQVDVLCDIVGSSFPQVSLSKQAADVVVLEGPSGVVEDLAKVLDYF